MTENLQEKIKKYSRREDDTPDTEGVDLALISHIDWYLDAITHSNSEKPKEGSECLVYGDNSKHVMFYHDEYFYIGSVFASPSRMMHLSDATKWIYIEDLQV